MSRLEIAETITGVEMLNGVKILLNEGSKPEHIADVVEKMYPIIHQISCAIVQYGSDKNKEDFTAALENLDIWEEKA